MDGSVILAGLYGFALMILYSILGGIVGGALLALLYNRVISENHGISVELEKG